jgi:hypothetical protein
LKSGYVPATRWRLQLRHDVPRSSPSHDSSAAPDPLGGPGRRQRRDRGGNRPPVAGVLVLGGRRRRSRWTTVFDDAVPGVGRLDPLLLKALRRAAVAAKANGVQFVVTSGWRSPAYEEQLLREAVSKYGSEEEAARWVATPSTSAHVSGNAVDLGPFAAAAWLADHGAAFGLCQIYRNEPWHYELRPKALGHGCPPMYADPTHDPRMQQ